MFKQSILTLALALLLTTAPRLQANSFEPAFSTPNTELLNGIVTSATSLALEAPNDTPRRGTENWEESQSSFLIFPGIILSILALIVFFNRK